MNRFFLTLACATSLFSWAHAADPQVCITNVDPKFSIFDATDPLLPPKTVVVPNGRASRGVAITPDGTQALFGSGSSGTNHVYFVNLGSSPSITDSVEVNDVPLTVAITPDQTKACVVIEGTAGPSGLTIIDLGDHSTTSLLNDVGFLSGVAITADSKWAWVTGYTADNNPSIFIVNLTTNSVEKTIAGPTPSSTPSIAMTTDNKYVVIGGLTEISIFDFEAQAEIASIPVGGITTVGVAISPDNKYACVSIGGTNSVVFIDLTTPDFTNNTTVPIGNLTFRVNKVAITPDSKTAWVVGTELGVGSLFLIDLTNGFSVSGPYAVGAINSRGIAISPDQAPTASFTYSGNNKKITFDGSASSSPFGTIKNYAWDFGDGSPIVSTSTPTVFHKYKFHGTYNVVLTVTNSSNTSTVQTFTGQTVSNNGGPSAQLVKLVNIKDKN